MYRITRVLTTTNIFAVRSKYEIIMKVERAQNVFHFTLIRLSSERMTLMYPLWTVDTTALLSTFVDFGRYAYEQIPEYK